MTAPTAGPGAEGLDTGVRSERRLDDDEMAVWLPLIRLVHLLPQALDRTLREHTGINHAHYAILVTLAETERSGAAAPTMRELARIAGLSPSRLSHAVDALARRGWVRRTSCADDRRAQRPELTEEGRRMLREAAPTHVAQIRSAVLEPLDPAQRRHLQDIATTLLEALEPDADEERPPRR